MRAAVRMDAAHLAVRVRIAANSRQKGVWPRSASRSGRSRPCTRRYAIRTVECINQRAYETLSAAGTLPYTGNDSLSILEIVKGQLKSKISIDFL